jgi:hypothetical protein
MSQEPEPPQTLSIASLAEEQTTLNTPSAGKGESSRRRLEILAEENAHLRLELETFRNRNGDARDAMDKMLSDLIVAQRNLREKDAAMDRQQGVVIEQKAQLEHLQGDVNRLSAELEESRNAPRDVCQSTELEQTLRKLTMEIGEKDLILGEREMDWKVQLHTLKVELAKQQMKGEKAVAELQELQTRAKDQDHSQQTTHLSQAGSQKAQAEQHLQELQQVKAAHKVALSQVDTEKARAQRYLEELELLGTKDSREETVNGEDNSQVLEQLKASHTAELAELRRISNFFKNNSERLSKEAKKLMAENRALKESVQTSHSEVQEHASTHTCTDAPDEGAVS